MATSCAPHQTHIPTQTALAHSMQWIDLQPGWRVRVVTPIIKSGGHLVQLEPAAHNAASRNNTQTSRRSPGPAIITLKTGKDFTGFEVSLYRVRAWHGGGVHVVFVSAVINRRGKKTSRRRPVLPLFRLPENDRFVRILHLAWASHGGHHAAILAANRRALLDAFSHKVALRPSTCAANPEVFCSWIPAGVAVIPERRSRSHCNGGWAPAF